jgi:hypothetical protein
LEGLQNPITCTLACHNSILLLRRPLNDERHEFAF